MSPSKDDQVTRRHVLRTAAAAALGGVGFGSSASAVAAEERKETGTETDTEAAKQFSALQNFAELSAALTVQVRAMDAIAKRSSDAEFKAEWSSIRKDVMATLNESQELVVDVLQKSIRRPGSEPEHTESIAGVSKLLAPQLGTLKLLTEKFTDSMPPVEKDNKDESQANDKQETSPPPARRSLGMRFEIASPFEAALADAGLYEDLAKAIGELAQKGLVPIMEGLESGEGLKGLQNLRATDWRSNLQRKRRTGANLYTVIPERVFEAVLNVSSQNAATRANIKRIDSSPVGENDPNWAKTRDQAEQTLAASEKIIKENVLALLGSEKRLGTKRSDARTELFQIRGATTELKMAHSMVNRHARLLDFGSR